MFRYGTRDGRGWPKLFAVPQAGPHISGIGAREEFALRGHPAAAHRGCSLSSSGCRTIAHAPTFRWLEDDLGE